MDRDGRGVKKIGDISPVGSVGSVGSVGAGDLKGELLRVIGLLLAVTVLGTVGYHVIEGWDWFDCLYMTVITITTTGYREVGKLSIMGKILSMFLMVFGVAIFLYSVDAIIPILLERRIERWKKLLEKMEGHCIVCGYGRMGKEMAKELMKELKKVVVVDIDATRVASAREDGIIAIQGDCTEEDVLEKAGVKRAKCIVACTNNDSINAFAVMVAKDLNPNIFAIAVLRTPGGEKKLKRAGADMLLSPYHDSARKVCVAVTRPTAADFIEIIGKMGTLMLEKMELKNKSFHGIPLKDTEIRKLTGCRIVAIERNGEVIFPDPDTPVYVGDILYVLGKEEGLKKAYELITVEV